MPAGNNLLRNGLGCMSTAGFRRLAREEDAQDLIEYGLLLGIITVASVLAIGTIGGKVTGYLSNLNGALP